MSLLDRLIATDAPRVEVKAPRPRKAREKVRERRKRRTDVYSRSQRSKNPRRR